MGCRVNGPGETDRGAHQAADRQSLPQDRRRGQKSTHGKEVVEDDRFGDGILGTRERERSQEEKVVEKVAEDACKDERTHVPPCVLTEFAEPARAEDDDEETAAGEEKLEKKKSVLREGRAAVRGHDKGGDWGMRTPEHDHDEDIEKNTPRHAGLRGSNMMVPSAGGRREAPTKKRPLRYFQRGRLQAGTAKASSHLDMVSRASEETTWSAVRLGMTSSWPRCTWFSLAMLLRFMRSFTWTE